MIFYCTGIKNEDFYVSLERDRQYLFLVNMIVDGINRLHYADGMFYEPFMLPLTNSITYANDLYIYSLQFSGATIIDNGVGYYYNTPNVDRYYGETTVLTDTDVETVDIKLMRMTFGAKVIANNLESGELLISLQNAPEMEIIYPETEISEIFTLNSDLSHIYQKDYNEGQFTNNYEDSYTVTISRQTDAGEVVPIDTKSVRFKRNMRTIINVNITDNGTEGRFNISYEDIPMTDNGNIIEIIGTK